MFHFGETFSIFVSWTQKRNIEQQFSTRIISRIFFLKQSEKVKAKIIWTIQLIEELERVPETYLKHVESTDGLYEIRIKLGKNIFRIFCFFDQGKLIILANGFHKKTQKTPKKEIDKALKIMEEYKNEDK